MSVKFFHIRNLTPYGDVSNNGGMTVAYQAKDKEIAYAVAVCSKKDNFCKKTGRDLAFSRLLGNSLKIQLPRVERDVESFLRGIL